MKQFIFHSHVSQNFYTLAHFCIFSIFLYNQCMSSTAKNLIIVIAGVAIIGGALWVGKPERSIENRATMGKFGAENLGLGFAYRLEPDGYTLIEQDQMDSTGPIQTLTLVNTKEYEELLNS